MTSHESNPAAPGTEAPGVACCGAPAPVESAAAEQSQPGEVLIISDSCCNPSAAPAEERAVKTVGDAIAASGANARSRLVSATDALGGALSPEILATIQSSLVRGKAQPPMVMIDGEIVASGSFTQQEVEAALAARFGATA
jgi:hypothetical protein